MTEAQQVAMIRTMLFFIGKQNYAPTASTVLAQLREATAASSGASSLTSGSQATVGGSIKQGQGTSGTPSWNRVNNVGSTTGLTTKI